jgi:anti-sigma factor (TIGR02949 family)
MSLIDRLMGMFGDSAEDGGGGGAQEMISCEEALSFIHEFLDGELEDSTNARVKAHFDACQRCYPHLHLEESFREAVRRAALGEKAPPELKARLMDLLAEAGADG